MTCRPLWSLSAVTSTLDCSCQGNVWLSYVAVHIFIDVATVQPMIIIHQQFISVPNMAAIFLVDKHIYWWHSPRLGELEETVSCLYQVYHIPNLNIQLLSKGELLQQGQSVCENTARFTFLRGKKGSQCQLLVARPHQPGQTIYWFESKIASQAHLLAKSMIHTVNYETTHWHFGHPSNKALKKAQNYTKGFPKNLSCPKCSKPCKDCAEGKMHEKSFSESKSRAMRLLICK